MIFWSMRFIAGSGASAPGMAAPPGDRDLEIAFSRAFLLELERGDLEKAALFARAFVKQHAEPDWF